MSEAATLIKSKNNDLVSNNKQTKHLSFFNPVIQRKLTINQPNDIYEQEADAVADRVMRMPGMKSDSLFFQPKPVSVMPVQRKCSACENEEKLHRKEDEKEELIQQKKINHSILQRKCTHC